MKCLVILSLVFLAGQASADSKPESEPDHGAVNHNHFHFTGQQRNGAYNPYAGYGGYPGGYGGYPGAYGGYGGYGAYPYPYGYGGKNDKLFSL